jgi:hypothetical protein
MSSQLIWSWLILSASLLPLTKMPPQRSESLGPRLSPYSQRHRIAGISPRGPSEHLTRDNQIALTFNGITTTADLTRLGATSCSLALDGVSVTITFPEVPRPESAHEATTTANESNSDALGPFDQDCSPPGAYSDSTTDMTGDDQPVIVAQRAHTNAVIHASHRLATRSPEAYAQNLTNLISADESSADAQMGDITVNCAACGWTVANGFLLKRCKCVCASPLLFKTRLTIIRFSAKIVCLKDPRGALLLLWG